MSRARLFSLTDAQLAQLKAAAATLRVGERDAFVRSVAAELARRPATTDAGEDACIFVRRYRANKQTGEAT